MHNNKPDAMAERKGRTPFRMEIKFTHEEWRHFGERANDANTSRYNFGKRAILAGLVLSPERLKELEQQYIEAARTEYSGGTSV